MLPLFLSWLIQTSLMPLFVGALTGGLAHRAWGSGCAASWGRRASWAAIGALLLHLVLVGGGLLREGSIWDYAAVLLAASLISAVACRGGRVTKRS
ncbi:conserved membrane hypothetical protein [Thiomonas sp. CB2]|nr:conserved membrane hypothetical protein [Thiomonas sp. CB2]VDY04522.1 conserved membrane protein of unknown function [Thiomonas sp. Bio17B3]VDY08307.1 conserved membrane protein of unknown function [Thiomonas sp. Sup16B3]VDY12773.1 conserved membrane protein of unknown function [Thiomonas sp. OC7]VDY18017.1 conserved membrane protein of unknown function [Thiomonas sp. CB2]